MQYNYKKGPLPGVNFITTCLLMCMQTANFSLFSVTRSCRNLLLKCGSPKTVPSMSRCSRSTSEFSITLTTSDFSSMFCRRFAQLVRILSCECIFYDDHASFSAFPFLYLLDTIGCSCFFHLFDIRC